MIFALIYVLLISFIVMIFVSIAFHNRFKKLESTIDELKSKIKQFELYY